MMVTRPFRRIGTCYRLTTRRNVSVYPRRAACQSDFAPRRIPVLLQIDERDHQLLLEVLGSAMLMLRKVDTAGYETIRQQREAVMVSLRGRLLAQPTGALVDRSDVRRVRA